MSSYVRGPDITPGDAASQRRGAVRPKPLILSCLCDGVKRFAELRDLIPDAPEKVLSQQLRELERDGLVARRAHYEGEDLPKAEYSLTPYGLTFRPVMDELRKWGGKHRTRRKAGRG